MEVPQMAFNDNAEHVRILSSVRKGIEGLRRRVQEVQPELSTSTSEAVNIARQEICASLIRRLVMAEKEVQELQDMIELNQKA
jgi:transcriptional regulatory protein LevR